MEENKIKIDLSHAPVKDIPKVPIKPGVIGSTNAEQAAEKFLAIVQLLKKKAVAVMMPYVVTVKKKIGARLIELGQKLSK